MRVMERQYGDRDNAIIVRTDHKWSPIFVTVDQVRPDGTGRHANMPLRRRDSLRLAWWLVRAAIARPEDGGNYDQ